MKKVLRLFISLSILLCCTGTVKGQEATDTESVPLVLGYCNSEVAEKGTGYDAAGLVSAAIYFPEERMKKLSGNKITKVRYGLVQNRMSSITFFIKDNLTGEALYRQTTTEKPKKGWNEILLDLPYIIEGQGIYIGIEYNQISTMQSFSFTGSDKPYSAFLALDNDWLNCYGKGYGSLSLQCEVAGEGLPQIDMNLSNVKTLPYVPDGQSVSVENEFGNFGTETIKELDFTYQINENEPVTVHKELDLPSGEFHSLSISNIECAASQINNIKVKIENPNGRQDENQSDNEQTIKIYSYSESYPRTTVVEQFTTEKCTNCPAGSAFLKTVLDNRSDVIWIAHHAGFGTDKYTIEASEDLLPFYGGGGLFAPAMMIDRTAFTPEPFPVTGVSTSAELLENNLKEANEVPAFATVAINADFEESTRKLHVEVSGDVLFLAGNDPRITIYITEDSLHTTTQKGAREYTHNHVPRIALTDSSGESFTVSEDKYSVSKECTVSEDWKAQHLHIVAILSNYDEKSINNRKILNAASVSLMKPVSILGLPLDDIHIFTNDGEIHITGSCDSFEIYTLTGQMIPNSHLMKGVYLVKINRDDESNLKKVVVR